MKISSKARYAVSATAELAERFGEFVSVGELSERRQIPRTFLEQLLLQLKNAGVTISRRGPDGGYALAASPDRIRLADVYTAVEGPVSLRRNSGSVASDDRVWGGLENAVLDYLNAVTLEDLVNADSPEVSGTSVEHPYTFSI